MPQGIFSSWDYSFLDKAENVLKKNLDINPVYPFEEIEPNIFILNVVSARFTITVTIIIITVVITGIVFGLAGPNEYLLFPILVIFLFSKQALASYEERRYVLDSNELMYEYYRGDKLIYRGHYHNCYIRLKGQNSGGGETYYAVVLNGFNLDEQAISATTVRLKKLAKLGRKLAARLNLNYFDSPDKSHCHVIRHTCPHRFADIEFGLSMA